MDHTEKLDALHKEAIASLEAYLEAKGYPKPETDGDIHEAKTEWQNAWLKLRELMMVLEKIEI